MRALPLALAALTLAAPAAAQDGSEGMGKRTVEGAQQFLAEFYGQNRFEALANGKYANGFVHPDEGGKSHMSVRGPLESIVNTGRCKTRITIFPAMKRRFGDLEPKVMITENSGRISTELDWSKVTKQFLENDWIFGQGGAVQENGRVNVHLWINGQDISFVHDTKEAAERANFAMQFLAEQCGLQSDTGF